MSVGNVASYSQGLRASEDVPDFQKTEKALTKHRTTEKVHFAEGNKNLQVLPSAIVQIQTFFSSIVKKNPALIAEQIKREIQLYKNQDLPCGRISQIFGLVLGREKKEELSERVSSLLHLFVLWNIKATSALFSLVSNPDCYAKASYNDVLELMQRLLYLYSNQQLHDEIVDALHSFHKEKMSLECVLDILRKERQEDSRLSKTKSNKEKNSKSEDLASAALTLAKDSLNSSIFFLLLNPASYYHVRDLSSFKNIVQLTNVLQQKGEDIAPFLEEFQRARVSLRDVESTLEQRISQLTKLPKETIDFDVLLGKFSGIGGDELKLMKEEYLEICSHREALHEATMNTLVVYAQEILHQGKEPSKKDSLFLLAIVREAISQQFGIYPHNTQMLTILGLLRYPAAIKGQIAQVKTGEGKSTVIAMLALYLALQGKCIDIISSSRYLAERDAEKYSGFFGRFGITTSHLCTDTPLPENFSGQIIFSTNFDAEFSIMRDYFRSLKLRVVQKGETIRERPFNVVIVDEVDNLFVDSALNSARIAIDSSLSMGDVYVPFFSFVENHEAEVRKIFRTKFFSRTKVFSQAKKIVQTFLKGTKEATETFLDERTEMLLLSAIHSLDLTEGKEYIIKSVEDIKEIVIVDQANTGRLAEKSTWSHGLHQFLEVKHELPIKEEHVMPASLCHPVFFGSYEEIYGLTGTMGLKIEREEIRETYNVGTFDVPPFRPSLRKDFEPIVCLTKEEHAKAICHELTEMISQERPTLVLFEAIQEANDFSIYAASHEISALTLTACQSDDEEFIIAQAGLPGKVTIATNTAGRGTDIVLQKAACAKGGLHVIFSYLPSNERVEQQGIGRAGRQGQPGSSRLIVCVDTPFVSFFSRLLEERHQEEFHKEAYTHLLHRREESIAKLSSERRFLSKIEQINHSFLLQFVQKVQALPESQDTQKQLMVQAWAEQFYTKLDELLVSVRNRCADDPDSILTHYVRTIQKFFTETFTKLALHEKI